MKKIASNPKLNNSTNKISLNENTKNISNSRVIQMNNPRNFSDIKDRLKANIGNELADQFKKK
jgi:hypothetical protein